MKTPRNITRLLLVLGVLLLFSLCAIEVRLQEDWSRRKEDKTKSVKKGNGEIAFKEAERVGDRERKDGGDHPDEAARFRRLQLQDEKGVIPVDGLEKARQHVKRMRVTGKEAKPSSSIRPDSWSWIGPGNIGGRIRSIVISPINSDRMWVGSVSGGIWRTDNGGDSWFPVNDFMANLAVSTMIIDPTFPTFLYAGTGENNAFQITRGAGVFKSTNSGMSWERLPSTDPTAPPPAGCNGAANCPWLYVNRLAISPNGDTILAATWNGIYRSANGGMTWNPTGNGGGSWLDIDFHPTNSLRAIAGNSGGAVFSTDGGASWTAATFTPPLNPPTNTSGRVELAYAPSSPNIIYASVNNNNGEVYRSTDGNSTNGLMTFTLVNATNNFFLGASNQGEYDNAIWVNPQDPAYVIVGGIDLWRSTNSGTNFTQISDWNFAPDPSIHADHHAIVSHPDFNNTDNFRVFFGNDGGFYKAEDIRVAGVFGFAGWTQLNNNLGITQFYGAAGNTVNGVIVGGAQDNGTLVYSGSTDWGIGKGGDGGYCAASPDGLFYYGEYVYLQIHRNIGLVGSFNYIYGGIADANNAAAANFIAPFILDPNDANRMLAGGISLWRSNNVKDLFPTWTQIKLPVVPPPPPPIFDVRISAIAVSPGNSNFIVVGHNDGDIYRTTNGAPTTADWQRIDAANLPNRFVTRLVIDSTRNPNWIYATFGGFRADNVYRSTDSGTTWADITGTTMSTKLPAVPVRSLVYHPSNPNLLYVGTEMGIFTSDDAGANWQLPQNGPANVSVDELFWMGADLIAVTHGRGLYRASGGIYVDCNYPGSSDGSFDRPYRTITEALNAATVYRTIWLKPCTYIEPMTIIKPNGVEIRRLGGLDGTAVIRGQP